MLYALFKDGVQVSMNYSEAYLVGYYEIQRFMIAGNGELKEGYEIKEVKE